MKYILCQDHAEGGSHVVLLFGSGLIGQSVEQSLHKTTRCESVMMPYSWNDAQARASQKTDIQTQLLQEAAQGAVSKLSVVWAGGVNGFGSSDADMAVETGLFSEVLEFFFALGQAIPQARRGVHMLSSAGGLFEGKRLCDAQTEPDPQRPYGHAKLEQEQLTRARAGEAACHIYRPSSVYGYANSARTGLITALISNALKGRTSQIFGKADTLRDYVFAGDIGRFVAQKLLEPSETGEATYLLAKGRPATMYEVISTVEQIMQTRLLLQFDPRPSNALDICFLPSALPRGWAQRDLATGIADVAMRLTLAHLRAVPPSLT